MANDDIWKSTAWIAHTQLLLDSYERWLGTALISRETSDLEQSKQLFEAPFVVLSHGTQSDPILNYGNAAALKLWDMDVTTFANTPSRHTAEPVHRDERKKVLERTTRDGYVDDYRGIRISSTGKRFQVNQATVWNLIDANGTIAGQAATFADWHWLETP
ncbi:MAG: MEKHLA domain-containing protein [Planctomycetaceae bacterium]|nr:MEKHLA domain-containing protein [Planctomycetaceae bacterium]